MKNLLQDTNQKTIVIKDEKLEVTLQQGDASIRQKVKDIADLASIDKNITPHSFRHGKAHNVLNNGGQIEDVQRLLRHVNLESSLHYININPSQYLQLAAKYL